MHVAAVPDPVGMLLAHLGHLEMQERLAKRITRGVKFAHGDKDGIK